MNEISITDANQCECGRPKMPSLEACERCLDERDMLTAQALSHAVSRILKLESDIVELEGALDLRTEQIAAIEGCLQRALTWMSCASDVGQTKLDIIEEGRKLLPPAWASQVLDALNVQSQPENVVSRADEQPMCGWYDDSDEELSPWPTCDQPATHYSCNNFGKKPLNACEKHKCRCKQPQQTLTVNQPRTDCPECGWDRLHNSDCSKVQVQTPPKDAAVVLREDFKPDTRVAKETVAAVLQTPSKDVKIADVTFTAEELENISAELRQAPSDTWIDGFNAGLERAAATADDFADDSVAGTAFKTAVQLSCRIRSLKTEAK